MIDIARIKTEIIDLADTIAAATLRLHNPACDEISTRQAQRLFGARWLAYHVNRGNVRGRRKGQHSNSPVTFSRTELAALLAAERRGAKSVKK